MTLPATPPMTMAQMAAEFGLGVGCVFPRDFYGKGGAPANGRLAFSDFLGRSNAAFSPGPGEYTIEAQDTARFTITGPAGTVWTWRRTAGSGGLADVGSGGAAASITFTLSAQINTTRTATFEVTAAGQTWNVTLIANNGGTGTSA